MARREFLKAGTGLAAVVAAGALPVGSVRAAAETPAPRKTIGIQVGAASFVDEGTEQVLDNLQQRGAIDTIFLTTFTYGRGWRVGRFRVSRFPITAPRNPMRSSSTVAITPHRIRSFIGTRC